MSIIYLLIMIAALALVIGWYLANETANADGEKGILATRAGEIDADPETWGRHYRIRTRGAPQRRGLRAENTPEESFKTVDRRARFTDREAAAYVARQRPRPPGSGGEQRD
jgi:hypothetical protein